MYLWLLWFVPLVMAAATIGRAAFVWDGYSGRADLKVGLFLLVLSAALYWTIHWGK